jgi:general secretion pathway protein D
VIRDTRSSRIPYNLDQRRLTYYIKRVLRPLCLVALCLAALGSVFGQQPKATSAPGVSPRPLPQVAPPAPSVPAKTATTEEPPAAVPPAQTQTNPAPPPSIPGTTPVPSDKTETLQFPNSDVVDVLRFYENITGKKLVMDNFVQGKVSIFLSRPVPREEAIRIIEMNLLMNGYSLVPAGGDVVKVIGTGRSPRNAGVPLISDEADLPEGEHVVSFLFKLRYADPIELQQVLGQYLSPPQSYTSFLALPKSSSLLITENSSVIRSLVHIVDQIDVPPAQVVSEFIKLERADASKVVEMLKDVFDKGGATTTTTTTVQPGVRPVRPANNVPVPQTQQLSVEGDLSAFTALSEDSIVVGKIKIAPDVRTNRIHVITRPVNMPFIKKLISEFDANVEFGKPVTRPLRYISAAEVLPVIVQTLTEPGGNQAGADTSNPAAPQQQAQQNQRRTNMNSSGFDSSSSSSSSGSQNFSEELSTQAVDTSPKAVTIGNAKIIADQRANAIIILGNKEVVVKVSKLLDEMDIKAPQVALSTVIGELTLKNDQTFGVDWFKNGGTAHTDANGVALPRTQGNSTFAGFGRNSGAPLVDPASLTNLSSLLGNVPTTGGTSLFLSSGRDGLAALVNALDSTGRFRVLNRPVVFTSNNKKAIIASGQEIPVPVNTLSSFIPTSTANPTPLNTFGTQSSIQYKKVALQLEVVPLINSEKEVSLDILQKLDSLGTPAVVDGNSIPTIVTRYIKTTVSAPNGSTIVLGGLITDNKQVSKDGIPLLSRIPLIGGLFRNTIRNLDRTELIVLMRPEVALTKLDIYRLRQKIEDKTHIGPELDSDDCPDCPKPGEDKQIQLPGPDLPGMK